MQPLFYMLGAQKNRLIETVPTTYVLVENILSVFSRFVNFFYQ